MKDFSIHDCEIAGVFPEINENMNYDISVDLAKGEDYAVVVDWAILDNGKTEIVNTSRV